MYLGIFGIGLGGYVIIILCGNYYEFQCMPVLGVFIFTTHTTTTLMKFCFCFPWDLLQLQLQAVQCSKCSPAVPFSLFFSPHNDHDTTDIITIINDWAGVSFFSISFHLISSHLISSHLIPSHPIPLLGQFNPIDGVTLYGYGYISDLWLCTVYTTDICIMGQQSKHIWMYVPCSVPTYSPFLITYLPGIHGAPSIVLFRHIETYICI